MLLSSFIPLSQAVQHIFQWARTVSIPDFGWVFCMARDERSLIPEQLCLQTMAMGGTEVPSLLLTFLNHSQLGLSLTPHIIKVALN